MARHWEAANKAAVLAQKEQANWCEGPGMFFMQKAKAKHSLQVSPVQQAEEGDSKIQFKFQIWMAAYLLDSQEPVSRETVCTITELSKH